MLKDHPLIYELVDCLRQEQQKACNEILRLKTGIKHKRRACYDVKDDRLQYLVNNYSNDKFDEFYDMIQLILKY